MSGWEATTLYEAPEGCSLVVDDERRDAGRDGNRHHEANSFRGRIADKVKTGSRAIHGNRDAIEFNGKDRCVAFPSAEFLFVGIGEPYGRSSRYPIHPGASPAGSPGLGEGAGVGVGLAFGLALENGPMLLAPVKNDRAAADSAVTAGLSR